MVIQKEFFGNCFEKQNIGISVRDSGRVLCKGLMYDIISGHLLFFFVFFQTLNDWIICRRDHTSAYIE